MFDEYEVVKSTRQLSGNVPKGTKGTVLVKYTNPRIGYEVEFVDKKNEFLNLLTVYPNDICKFTVKQQL